MRQAVAGRPNIGAMDVPMVQGLKPASGWQAMRWPTGDLRIWFRLTATGGSVRSRWKFGLVWPHRAGWRAAAVCAAGQRAPGAVRGGQQLERLAGGHGDARGRCPCGSERAALWSPVAALFCDRWQRLAGAACYRHWLASAVVLLPWFWRTWLGRVPALTLALLFAVDPWLVAFSRTADGASLTIFLALLTMTALWQWHEAADGQRSAALGARQPP